MVNRHADWSAPAFQLRPAASLTGPFAGRAFLETLWNHDPAGDLLLVETESALVPLVQGDFGLQWVGHPDLVDYRSPLGEGSEDLVADLMSTSGKGLRYRFDSLPDRAADAVQRGLAKAGLVPQPVQHTVAARVALPDSFEGYLEMIGRKQRHEIRRKRRRFQEEHGPPEVVTWEGTGEGFHQFVDMHRGSGGAKGRFMTAQMEGLFDSLAGQPGWRTDVLYGEDGRPRAAAFGWADSDGFYLYNSAFDRLSTGSPGIVLLSMLIKRAIETGGGVFDFLKGDEPYKFRLGAVARPLYRFEGSL